MADIKFGLSQLNKPTPTWAQLSFGLYFIISKAVLGYIAALAELKELNIDLLTLELVTLTISMLLDPIVLGMSQMFGVNQPLRKSGLFYVKTICYLSLLINPKANDGRPQDNSSGVYTVIPCKAI